MAVDTSRVDRGVTDLRRHAARGTLVNSAFQVGLGGLNVLQRVIVAAFLTRPEFGLWGIVTAILVNLSWLRDLGIADKFIQQNEDDQEAAFQKAFTLELLVSVAFFVLVAVVLPIWSLAYGRPEMILPGLLVTLAMPISAFESPSWIPYRRLQYARQRWLTVIDPLVGFVVTVALAIAGAGYWCFVAGVVSGSIAGAIVCTATSPYPVRLRFDRGTLREYVTFSWPLVGAGMSRLVVVQGSLIVANHVVGLAGVGAITLATSFAVFADRVDGIVSATLYPAVCAVADRRKLLVEAFTKSNRIALIWAMPFGAGLALFSADLVHYVLGDRWKQAIGLLATFGLTCALGQLAFNWGMFLRAVNHTRPILVGAVVYMVTFLGVSVPAMLLFGVAGYAAAFAIATAIQVVLRGYYMNRLFRGFNVLRQLVRSIAPVVPGSALVVLLRLAVPGHRTPAQVLGELVLFFVASVGFTILLERRLVREMVDYLLPRSKAPSLVSTATSSGG